MKAQVRLGFFLGDEENQRAGYGKLNIQVRQFRITLDERFAGRNVGPHENIEYAVGILAILNPYLF